MEGKRWIDFGHGMIAVLIGLFIIKIIENEAVSNNSIIIPFYN